MVSKSWVLVILLFLNMEKHMDNWSQLWQTGTCLKHVHLAAQNCKSSNSTHIVFSPKLTFLTHVPRLIIVS